MSQIKVFVGSLPQGITEEVLQAYLSPYGPISSCMLKAEARYAFVFYPDVATANQAIQGMNGLPVEGSPIVAKLARNTGGPGGMPAAPVHVTPIRAVPPRGLTPQAAFRGTPGAIPGERVYVKGLPAGMTDEAVRHLFAGYGSVADSKVLVADGQTSDGTGQSVAIVRMATVAEAQWIVDNLNGNIPETLERPVDVSFAGARAGAPAGHATPYGAGAAGYSPLAPQPGAPPPPMSRPPVWATAAAMAPVAAAPVAVMGRPQIQHSVHPSVQALKLQCPPNSKLYVKGLPAHADDAYLFKIFAPWGRVAEAVTLQKGEYCIGFVTYLSEEEAAQGIEQVNGVTLLDGVTLTVAVKAPKA